MTPLQSPRSAPLSVLIRRWGLTRFLMRPQLLTRAPPLREGHPSIAACAPHPRCDCSLMTSRVIWLLVKRLDGTGARRLCQGGERLGKRHRAVQEGDP
jgi:hypothetical protein